MPNQQTAQQQAAAQNAYARKAINASAVRMCQQVFGQTYANVGGQNLSNTQAIINIPPRNVGLIRGFWVQIIASVNNGSAVPINLTDFGPANVLSGIQYTDLNNNVRIQTAGWHVHVVNSVKDNLPIPFGASFVRTTGFDSPVNWGSNFINQISAPAQIAAGITSTINMWYWVPLAYGDWLGDDLRGAVYANVVTATQLLALTINPAPVVANGTDSTLAMYAGNAAGSVALAVISAMTVNVYQEYLDQLPQTSAGVLLPIMDIATIYELKNVATQGVVTGQDFPYQYANYRDIVSTTLIYVNTGATGARGVGSDLNYLSLQSANFTNIWKYPAGLQALKTREVIGTDMPPGVYYFPTRRKPISTIQYGNQQLVLNANVAGAGNYALLGIEDLAVVQQLSQAGSLAAS